jgi:hypothetical protein
LKDSAVVAQLAATPMPLTSFTQSRKTGAADIKKLHDLAFGIPSLKILEFTLKNGIASVGKQDRDDVKVFPGLGRTEVGYI